MAIKVQETETPNNQGVNFPESALAHQYCIDNGVEIGAAAHNSFGLPGSINVAPEDDYQFYVEVQNKMCGAHALIDIVGEADDTQVDDHSQNYVISSHAIEHFPDVVGAFLEWNRILRLGGIIFMTVPHRDAHPPDVGRELSSVEQLFKAYEDGWTAQTVPADVVKAAGGQRGHIWVFTLDSMLQLIAASNEAYGLSWDVVDTLAVDDKVGNGFTVVAKYSPTPEEKPVVELPHSAGKSKPVEKKVAKGKGEI